MVNYAIDLDDVFGSLADGTRRDILKRLTRRSPMTVSEVAAPYKVSLAAISKHLSVLEKAHLIRRQKQGKERLVTLSPQTLRKADEYVAFYEKFWNSELDSLETFLAKKGKQ